ncbi:uncharacterized protein LOC120141097 [Hibiscus syriacus]|uniref:uncharacterized protein LOC120141097 n=1 Tax=Hibiscus syriacus TaxID=106335 RepID=UPI0019250E0A|nr:uncharacterized protein LOC120141097 [Hibiscus syriacus]
MYQEFRQLYWRLGMKREVSEFVARCQVVSRLRQNTRFPQGYSNLFRYFSRNGTRNLLCWTKFSNGEIMILDIIREIEEKDRLIQCRLREALDRQRSYTDLKHKDVEFVVEDKVLLKVFPL